LGSKAREALRARIEQVTQGTASSFGMDYRFDFEYGYPVLINDPEMTRLVASACSKGIGNENVKSLGPSMGAEDFAYYLEKAPGSFFRLGIGNEAKGIVHPYHNSRFDIDEEVLPFGVEMFIRIIDQFLGLEMMK
jgi:amidohydrolase